MYSCGAIARKSGQGWPRKRFEAACRRPTRSGAPEGTPVGRWTTKPRYLLYYESGERSFWVAFGDVDRFNPSSRRTVLEPSLVPVDVGGVTLGVGFDSAVREVGDPPGQAQRARKGPGLVPEADSLHPAPDEYENGDGRFLMN